MVLKGKLEGRNVVNLEMRVAFVVALFVTSFSGLFAYFYFKEATYAQTDIVFDKAAADLLSREACDLIVERLRHFQDNSYQYLTENKKQNLEFLKKVDLLSYTDSVRLVFFLLEEIRVQRYFSPFSTTFLLPYLYEKQGAPMPNVEGYSIILDLYDPVYLPYLHNIILYLYSALSYEILFDQYFVDLVIYYPTYIGILIFMTIIIFSEPS
jgi:hypothetical protein